MSWIEESDLPGVPAIFRVMSLNPAALDVVKQLNEVVSFGNSGLSRQQEEAIATVVAVTNRCRYEAMTHAGFLRRHGKSQEMAGRLLSDYTQASLPPLERRMLDFSVRVTRDPGSLTEADVQGLHDVGLKDGDILAIVLVACLSNFMDRLANSLGVDVPPALQKAVGGWLTEPAGQQSWLVRPPGARGEDTSDVPQVAPNDSPARVIQTEASITSAARAQATRSEETTTSSKINRSQVQPPEAQGDSTGDSAAECRDTQPEEPVAQTKGKRRRASQAKSSATKPNELAEAPPAEEPDAQESDLSNRQETNGDAQEAWGIHQFVDSCCVTSPDRAATARDLYISYLRWCDESDQQPMRQRDFGVNLAQLGYRRQRRGRGRHWWLGIGLADEND
ncbi:MAG: peroxidase-related enzyme [Chloroflexi bacterium]|nr:peroxidase-related enzyme [Chloroflexota bacterium]